MVTTLTHESLSIEPRAVDISSSNNVTGLPKFCLTDEVATSPPARADSSWVTGTWSEAWANGLAEATTPLIGAGQDLPVVEGDRKKCWINWVAGTHDVVALAFFLHVN